MKNCIKGLYAALLITIAGLSGCENPLSHMQPPDRSGNSGYVAVKIETPYKVNASMARTIYPELSGFTKYELSFSDGPEPHDPVDLDGNNSVELAVGEWMITVTAFTGTEGATAAARGSVPITVNPGQTTEASINLTPITGEGGTGTFNYTITVPSGASGNLVVTTTAGAVVNGGNINLLTESTTDSIDLPVGQYLMSISLTLSEKRAGRTEVLHIYPSMTSRAEYQFFLHEFQSVNILFPNNWMEGTLSSGGIHWYQFTASEGATYEVQWNDSYGDGTKTLAASVSAYTSNGDVIFENKSSGWTSPQTVSNVSGIVYLKVQGAEGNNTGTYAIKYYDPSSLPPQAGLTLSLNAMPFPLAVVSWNSVLGATGYRLYRSTTPDSDYTEIVSQTDVTYMDTSGLAGTRYYYKICAYNENGDGSLSPVVSIEIPAATTLSMNTWANSTINSSGGIHWYQFTASTGTTYEVQWNDSDGDGTKTLSASVSAYTSNGDVIFENESSGWTEPQTVSGLSGNVFLKVQGANSSDTGDYALKYYDPTTAPPEAPGVPTIITIGDGQLTVSWVAVPRTDTYEVYYDTSTTPPSAAQQSGISETPTTITGLTNGSRYHVWVKAKNAAGTSDYSSEISGMPIATPEPTSATAQSFSSILVSWNSIAEASGYNLYRASNESGDYTKVNASPVIGTSYTDTGLNAGTTYYYKASALNQDGVESEQLSSPVSAATPALSTVWYVSSAGNDTNNGADPATPLATITKALELTRDAYSAANYPQEDDAPISTSIIISGTITESSKTSGMIEINETVYPPIELRGKSETETGTLNANQQGRVLYITEGNKVTLGENLTITGGDARSDGGGVYNNGTFTMSGGVISGNIARYRSGGDHGYGGGVYNNGGTFTMSGGVISDNIAAGDPSSSLSSSLGYGGGVYNGGTGCTFIMSGGEISGNTASGYGRGGGGVYSNGTFTMNDGTISGNTSGGRDGGGHGVYSSGTFTMNGGTISGNTSMDGSSVYGYGGGVYSGGRFTMNDGTIFGNTAVYGGGVYSTTSGFKKTGGIIYGDTDTTHTTGSTENTATRANSGHAVFVNSSSDKRNSTAGTDVMLDSSVAGSAGGWEE
jgi:fibronectin type 3 domain-containing protein